MAQEGQQARKRPRADAVESGAASSQLGSKKIATKTELLPIHAHKKEIVDAVRQNRVVVLVGETGSGKTTQVPQYLYEAGFARKGSIVVTQPRRIAAISIATRVAEEMGTSVGGLVGYKVRFLNSTSWETRLKYMTDGMLVRESAGEDGLSGCSVLILDEAHERSVHTDILLGLVKTALDGGKHPELRVIVMSATIQATPFINFFGGPSNVQLLKIPGRLYPVETFYTPVPEPDFLEGALIAILQIHIFRKPGDMLVFLPGQEDIDGLQRLLGEKRQVIADRRRDAPDEPIFTAQEAGQLAGPPAKQVGDFVVRPIFAALPFDQQELVFQAPPPGVRKIVLATNIAETSITIPGIRVVIDTGLVKMKLCHPQTGIEILQLVETSKASAQQRAGRAGREAPGEVYRLYVESYFSLLPAMTPPEILRCELASIYLQLKTLGVANVAKFPLVDRPPQEALVKAAHFLCRIGALDRSSGELTEVGRKLSIMPIHPLYSYLLLISSEFECVAEALTIVAMISTETPFFISKKGTKEASGATRPVLHEDGDHLSLLSIFTQWKKHPQPKSFAFQHDLNNAALKLASNIREQLKELVQRSWNMQISSCGGPKNWMVVRRCLLKACFTQTARLDEVSGNTYQTLLSRQEAKLHPSSILFKKRPLPQCVVYAELVTTSKNYLRTVTEVDPSWLTELCPQHFAVPV